MLRDLGNSAHGVPLVFNLSFLAALPVVFAYRRAFATVADVSDRAITWASGHLGPRPDPWLEDRLRCAFWEIDRDLAAILHDESSSR